MTTPAAASEPGRAFTGVEATLVEGAGGVPLAVFETGDRGFPGILFIHGYRQSHLAWAAQFDSTLAARAHLVAFDLRGHGDSGAPWASGSYDHDEPWAEDVDRVIRATGLVKPLIVAWSFGGNVALAYLRAHPEAAPAGLVLVGTTARLLAAHLARKSSQAGATAPLAFDLAARASTSAGAADLVYGSGVDPATRALFAAVAMRAGPYVDRGVATWLEGPDNTDLAVRLVMPVTIAFGGHDPILKDDDAASLKVALATARSVRFDRSAHAPFLDDAAAFNALLVSMLQHASPTVPLVQESRP